MVASVAPKSPSQSAGLTAGISGFARNSTSAFTIEESRPKSNESMAKLVAEAFPLPLADHYDYIRNGRKTSIPRKVLCIPFQLKAFIHYK